VSKTIFPGIDPGGILFYAVLAVVCFRYDPAGRLSGILPSKPATAINAGKPVYPSTRSGRRYCYAVQLPECVDHRQCVILTRAKRPITPAVHAILSIKTFGPGGCLLTNTIRLAGFPVFCQANPPRRSTPVNQSIRRLDPVGVIVTRSSCRNASIIANALF